MSDTPTPEPKPAPAPSARASVFESGSPGSHTRVDRVNHVIRNVKLLGRFSKNVHPESGKNYRYSDAALSGFAKLQEGARVHIDHLPKPTDALDKTRDYATQFGDTRNVRADFLDGPEAGTYGDLHYNPKHALAEQILFDAEHAPHRLAMSHVATGMGRDTGEYHEIETAERVAGVDLVTHGGTNVSLFESENRQMHQENLKLAERVTALESDLALERKRTARRADLVKAGIASPADALVESLVRATDADAAILIEGLKVAEAPQSRSIHQSPGTAPKIDSVEDFRAALAGKVN